MSYFELAVDTDMVRVGEKWLKPIILVRLSLWKKFHHGIHHRKKLEIDKDL